MKAGIPHLLFAANIIIAAANEDNVCPDGNEKSLRGAIKSSIPSIIL